MLLLQFHQNDQFPLVADYSDLLLEAIDHNKIDIARKLAFLGVDCSISKPVSSPFSVSTAL